jgi:pyruvate dehydrogenase E1 component beta subunit
MALITVRQALNDAFKEEMARDSTIIFMGCDVAIRGGPFGISVDLLKMFGDKRVIDTPISESSFVGAGVGAAATGLRPVVEVLYSDWITLGMDQLVNMAAKMRYMFGGKVNMPLVVRAPFGMGGGIAAQHSQSFEAWFNHVPGFKVVAPIEPYDVKGLLKSAIRDNNPVIFFEHKRSYGLKGEVPDGAEGQEYTVPIGKAAIRREGSDVTIVSYSMMALRAKSAAEALAKEGISCEVIDLRTIVPLDYDTVMASVNKTHRVVVCHESNKRGGLGGDIVAEIIERGFDMLDAPPIRVAAPNVPTPYNKGLEELCIPDENKIIQAVRNVLRNE